MTWKMNWHTRSLWLSPVFMNGRKPRESLRWYIEHCIHIIRVFRILQRQLDGPTSLSLSQEWKKSFLQLGLSLHKQNFQLIEYQESSSFFFDVSNEVWKSIQDSNLVNWTSRNIISDTRCWYSKRKDKDCAIMNVQENAVVDVSLSKVGAC